jgi:asparagine synthase (glutamine-hydrolysing)
MCGISGIINFNSSSSNSTSLMSMTNSMIHRGPDNEGYVLINEANAFSFHGSDSIDKNFTHIETSKNLEFNIGLGFRQLKIIDLTNNSHQPMTDFSKNFWIVFNGEIYNYKEIKTELKSLGYTFNSNSDTEVLLKSYIEWSSAALDKLNGMFSFAIFNKAKNELFIARDRLGIKPLHYYQKDNVFLFASTSQAIIDSGIYEKEIDYEGLWENFRFSMAQNSSTCFANIKSLEAGHFMVINTKRNSIEKKQYWEIPVNTQDESLTENQCKSLLEDSLNKSISYRLNADVEVGSFMSGGIDSTTISVLAGKINPNIKTLTLGFNQFEQFNEIKQAKETARKNNLKHVVSTIQASEVIKTIEQVTLSYSEPYHSLSASSVIVNMAKTNKLKVVLNGLGGDELFGGYDMYYKLQFWNNLKKSKTLLNLIPSNFTKIKKAQKLSNYKSVEEFYNHYYSLFNDSEIKKLIPNQEFNTNNCLKTKYNSKNLNFADNFEALSFYNLKSYIGNHQLRSVDSSTMSHSIEGRLPMLDHEFIETAYKIPTKYKTNIKQPKYILRKVAQNHIAPSCLTMAKKGLSLPLENWISRDLKEFVYDNIISLKNRNIFNNNEIDFILKSKNPFKTWQLVSTELWLKLYF